MWIGFVLIAAWPWPVHPDARPLVDVIMTPAGFTRVAVGVGSFGEWLRQLPLKPGRPPVVLYNGDLKQNQNAHHAVVAIDVGRRDLQQCADAVMRLRAEYLWAGGKADAVCFRFTSGDAARWQEWRQGLRPHIKGKRVTWSHDAQASRAYATFRSYLDTVFTYAGSSSLAQEIVPVADPQQIEVGDVFIQGGFPGHAVIVVDVAANAAGERRFLLAQSYMPAQEIHVLVNPQGDGPWYSATGNGLLVTPEWEFEWAHLRRFGPSCARP